MNSDFVRPRDDSRERRLPAPRRAPQQHRAHIVALDLRTQRFPRPEQFFLADEFIERLRTHAVRQRPPRLAVLPRGSIARKSPMTLDQLKVTSCAPVALIVCACDSLPSLPRGFIQHDRRRHACVQRLHRDGRNRNQAHRRRARLPAAVPRLHCRQKSRRLPSDRPQTLVARRPAAAATRGAVNLHAATRSCASNTGIAIPRKQRKRSADPADARSALGDHGSAVPRVATAPVAPNASAERKIVPTFPGSCTAASTITSGELCPAPLRPAQHVLQPRQFPLRLPEERSHALRCFRVRDRPRIIFSVVRKTRDCGIPASLSLAARRIALRLALARLAYQQRFRFQARRSASSTSFGPSMPSSSPSSRIAGLTAQRGAKHLQPLVVAAGDGSSARFAKACSRKPNKRHLPRKLRGHGAGVSFCWCYLLVLSVLL